MASSANFCGSDVVGVVATRPSDNPRQKEKGPKKIVAVSWIDSYTDGGWAEYDPEEVETTTYGILVDENEKWTTLAMTEEKGYWGNLWYIPTKNVIKIRVIEDSAE
tara:strand:- start:2480 stop:2797 length:318 start_codon:yes stop_codon:yes gene_type:complete